MIFNYSILRGYTALRGTMVIHLPMLISMLVFVQIPSTECKAEKGSPNPTQECFERGPYWYYLAIGLHALLAFLHILMIIENSDFGKKNQKKQNILPQYTSVYLESAKIFAIPLQVLNFIF